MNSPNEDRKPTDNTELVKEKTRAYCGPDCGCANAGKPGKARWVVGVIVLAAAGVMVVRGIGSASLQ